MENYITLFISMLEQLKLIDGKKAEKLNKELRNTTIPSSYEESREKMKKLFEQVIDK